MPDVKISIIGEDKFTGTMKQSIVSVNQFNSSLENLIQTEKKSILESAVTAQFKSMTDAEKEAFVATQELNRAQQAAAENNKSVSLSWTDLNSAVSLGKEAFAAAQQVVNETVGTFQAYAQQVRDLSAVSGQGAADTSRFIQVLDDWQISSEDAMAATKALTKQGLAPNIETLAKLSDQYLAITDTQARNEFVIKNLGRAGLQWNQVLEQGSAALRDQAAAVSGALILDEKMLARAEKLRLAQDQLNDSWDATKIAIGEKAVPLLTTALDHFNKKVEESNIFQAIFTTGFDDIFQVIRDTVTGVDDATVATNKLTQAQGANVPTAEELAAAQKQAAEAAKAVSDAIQNQISTISAMQSAEDSYTQKSQDLTQQRAAAEQKLADLRAQGYYEQSSQVQNALADVEKIKQSEADLAKEREKQMLQFLSGILQQQLARDGWTQAEFNAFAKQQEAWGLWSADTVAKAQAAYTEVDKITASINDIPTNRTVNVSVNYTTATSGPNYNPYAGQSGAPHATGGSFVIPNSYGNEGFRMGNGDTASAGETLTISPRGQGGDIVGAIEALKNEFRRLPRMLGDELRKGGG